MNDYLPGGPHSARCGTIAANYLFVGFRPNCTFGELIAISEDHQMFVGWLDEQISKPIPMALGFDAYSIIEPGRQLAWDVFQNPDTLMLFVGQEEPRDIIRKWMTNLPSSNGGRS